jgi:hypothetical protein
MFDSDYGLASEKFAALGLTGSISNHKSQGVASTDSAPNSGLMNITDQLV